MSKKSLAAALLAASFVLVTIACGKSNAPETSKPSAASSSSSGGAATSSAPASTPAASASALKVDVKVDPAQPNPSKPAKFSAHVTDADGKPVSGADVNASLVMKE